MGMPIPAEPVTSIDELLALPDDGLRHELLDGVHVVTPSPALPHQAVLRELVLALGHVLEAGGRRNLKLLTSPADLRLGPKTLVQPDIFVYMQDPGSPATAWKDVGVPVLAIEILSPSTAARDRGAKRRIYQRAGVAEYWIVDIDARLIERWTPGDERPEIIDGSLRWDPTGAPRATIDVQAMFTRAME